MRGLFKPVYERALKWSKHPKAERFLCGLSFAEAFCFPGMPEILLAPMTLAKPQKWARYASLSLVWSTLGSLIGYAMGYYALQWVEPALVDLGYAQEFEQVRELARTQGFWLLLVGGFTPVPLKLLTFASGAVHMPLFPFLAGMIIGRGKRVYLLCGLIRLGGEKAEAAVHRWIEWIGWGITVVIVLLIIYFKFRN